MENRQVRVGDKFRCMDGTLVIVVDKAQKKQTRGYWVSGDYTKGIEETASCYNWPNLGWDIIQQNGSWEAFATKFGSLRKSGSYLCLCAESELDIEENEFGLVTP